MSICGWVRGVVTFFYPAQLSDAMRQQDFADQLADREAEEEVAEPQVSPTGTPLPVGDGPGGVERLYPAPPPGPPTPFWDQTQK